jgi:hypothetical protein
LVYVLTQYDLPLTEALEVQTYFNPGQRQPPLAQLELSPIQAASLRRCTLDNILLPWTSPGLTHLELKRDTTKDLGLPKGEALLALLRSSPSLENLHIENWIPDCAQLLTGGFYSQIPLSKLQNLFLSATSHRCASIWRLLCIPTSAMLTFELIDEPRGPVLDLAPVHSFFGDLALHLHDKLDAPWGLSIQEDIEFNFEFRLFRPATGPDDSTRTVSHPHFSPFDTGFHECLRVRLASFEWADDLPTLLASLGVNTSKISTLAVRCFEVIPILRWLDLFGALVNVNNLHVRSFSVDDKPQTGLVSALATGVPPDLHSIWMRDVILEDRDARRRSAIFQERVLDMLRARIATGLGYFRISRMPTDLDAVPELADTLRADFLACARAIVPAVEWNRADERFVSREDYNWEKPWRLVNVIL